MHTCVRMQTLSSEQGELMPKKAARYEVWEDTPYEIQLRDSRCEIWGRDSSCEIREEAPEGETTASLKGPKPE